jgi:hypothetical protein
MVPWPAPFSARPPCDRAIGVTSETVEPPPDQVTRPDQLDPAAAREFGPLDDERIVAVWRSHPGFLLLTNLRVVFLWRTPKLLGLLGVERDEWHEGPDFLLGAIAPPRATERFVELEEPGDGRSSSARFPVQNPRAVAAAIAHEIPSGRTLWLARRARVLERMRADRSAGPSPTPGVVREVVRVVVRVPCRYCGSLMDEGAARCPTCGAGQR